MPTIKNFGFMWEREKVYWGARARGDRSTLEGVMVRNRNRKVDFSDQMGIYVLYDRFEHPVQIGQSKNILKRLREPAEEAQDNLVCRLLLQDARCDA